MNGTIMVNILSSYFIYWAKTNPVLLENLIQVDKIL